MTPLRILLIDDHALFRAGMRLLLQANSPAYEVIEAESLDQAMRVMTEPPELVLLDVELQGLNGVEGLTLLRKRWPAVPVVMISSAVDAATIRLALERGAVAFFPKSESADRMMQVIAQALAGQVSGRASSDGLGRVDGNNSQNSARPRLTPRQCEVLDLLCEGHSNKVIARRLELSEFTVRGHVQAVLGLLGVGSRSQAMYAARRSGLIG
jgi:DNA-binding NarL/FixJ family response regulator